MMNRLRFTHKLRASTLVEALVALVIITLVMALAATLYVSLGRKRPDHSANLHLMLKQLALETRQSGDYSPADYQLDDGVHISRLVEPFQEDTLLLILELRAVKAGTADTALYREIIINTP